MGERRPGRVYDAGDEPDPRFSLANERTFLAWTRTALALIAGAVAMEALAFPEPDGFRAALAVVLLALGALIALLAWTRWARVERALRTRRPLPDFRLGGLMAAAIAAVAAVLALFLLLD